MRILRRRLRDTQNPFEIVSDEYFMDLYRFPKHLCIELIEELRPYMSTSYRVYGLDSCIKVLSALRFFATGSYQRAIGQDNLSALSQTSVSRCIAEISIALNRIAHHHVKFPVSEQYSDIKRKFFEFESFPSVIGLVDGTHIKIMAPNKEIEHIYYCRKGGHSKNVQIVCDADYIILSATARFGGTAHDAYVWRCSKVKEVLQDRYSAGERNFWLLGDSGYPLQPWLMTPIENPTSEAEERYNVAHKKTRSHVERCIGVLKSRFRCLSAERTLCYSPEKAGLIINACIVLHNFLMRAKVPITNEEIVEEESNGIQDVSENELHDTDNLLSEGRRVRSSIVSINFT